MVCDNSSTFCVFHDQWLQPRWSVTLGDDVLSRSTELEYGVQYGVLSRLVELGVGGTACRFLFHRSNLIGTLTRDVFRLVA